MSSQAGGRRSNRAIREGTLGAGSVAGDEYVHDMAQARQLPDGSVKWVETCFCATPLEEERPYWEAYFDLESIKDAHARSRCRHENGAEHWACSACDCTGATRDMAEWKGQAILPVQRVRRPAAARLRSVQAVRGSMTGKGIAFGLAVVLLAVLAGFAPIDTRLVERWYSTGIYPPIQQVLTPVSNLVPFALLDVVAVTPHSVPSSSWWCEPFFWRDGRGRGSRSSQRSRDW